MRCAQCNVDLSETARACPLCGAKAQEISPLIPGQRTAEYPEVQYRKYEKNSAGISFLMGISICLLCGIIEYMLTKKFSVTPLVASILPCVWALAVRPAFNRRVSGGNHIMTGLFVLSLSMLCVGWLRHIALARIAGIGIPVLFAAATLIFFAVFVARKRQRARSLIFLLFMAVPEAALLIIALVRADTSSFLPALALALTSLDIIIIFAASGKEARRELTAFFHA